MAIRIYNKHDFEKMKVAGRLTAKILNALDDFIKVGMTTNEINDFCQELPRYKRPRKIIFAPVPRNATGKIEKLKLREIYCHGRLVEVQNRS